MSEKSTIYKAVDFDSLINTIAKGANITEQQRIKRAEIQLSFTDSRIIGQAPEREPENIDIETIYEVILDNRLKTYVKILLRDGVPFTTKTGQNSDKCILEWTIEKEVQE